MAGHDCLPPRPQPLSGGGPQRRRRPARCRGAWGAPASVSPASGGWVGRGGLGGERQIAGAPDALCLPQAHWLWSRAREPGPSTALQVCGARDSRLRPPPPLVGPSSGEVGPGTGGAGGAAQGRQDRRARALVRAAGSGRRRGAAAPGPAPAARRRAHSAHARLRLPRRRPLCPPRAAAPARQQPRLADTEHAPPAGDTPRLPAPSRCVGPAWEPARPAASPAGAGTHRQGRSRILEGVAWPGGAPGAARRPAPTPSPAPARPAHPPDMSRGNQVRVVAIRAALGASGGPRRGRARRCGAAARRGTARRSAAPRRRAQAGAVQADADALPHAHAPPPPPRPRPQRDVDRARAAKRAGAKGVPVRGRGRPGSARAGRRHAPAAPL
jgi:hypothetical protein